jgi:hypothetical protein
MTQAESWNGPAQQRNIAESISVWMSQLAAVRPVFHSEADFQFALSKIVADSGVARIRLERSVPTPGGHRFKVDIMGYLDAGTPIALELKYPKARFVGEVHSDGYVESFALPDSAAFDLDAYGIWKDANRIEVLIAAGIVKAGAVIGLTNYAFWAGRSHKFGTQGHEFRLWQDREVSPGTELRFPETARWGTKDYAPVRLRSHYRCSWRPYARPCGQEFRYMVLTPDPSTSPVIDAETRRANAPTASAHQVQAPIICGIGESSFSRNASGRAGQL